MNQEIYHNPEVLWKTRGKEWEYTFVCKPSTPKLLSWQYIFEDIFEKLKNRDSPSFGYGKLTVRRNFRINGEFDYLAAIWFSEDMKDRFNRPIRNSLLCLFAHRDKVLNYRTRLSQNWYLEVLSNAITIYYNDPEIFALKEEEVEKISQKGGGLENFFCNKFKEITFKISVEDRKTLEDSKDTDYQWINIGHIKYDTTRDDLFF